MTALTLELFHIIESYGCEIGCVSIAVHIVSVFDTYLKRKQDVSVATRPAFNIYILAYRS